MANDFEGFEELEATIRDILDRTRPARRARVLVDIGRVLRKSQAKRIERQKNPDGTKYKPRQKKLPLRKRLSATRFLYPMHGSGPARVVFMQNWTFVGKRYIAGFDLEEGRNRTFRRDKIIKFLGVTGADQPAGVGEWKEPSLRQQAMFKRIRLPKWLQGWQESSDSISAGFRGDVVRIAYSHQDGLDGHARRGLIGLSADDERLIVDKIDELVGSGG